VTPAAVVAGLPVLAEAVPAVAHLVKQLVDVVREQAPELLGPLPAGLPEVDAARAEAVERVEGGA